MVITAPPGPGTFRERMEAKIRRRDLFAWAGHGVLGLAILINPPLSVQSTIGTGTALQVLLGGFFLAGGLVGFIVRARGRYRAEKLALTLTWSGLLMYLGVLLFASKVGYPSAAGLVVIVLLLTYLDRQRIERRIFEHLAGEQPDQRPAG